jgi:hypothetical protein
VDQPPDNPPPRPVEPVILSYASILPDGEVSFEINEGTVRYVIPPRNVRGDFEMILLVLLALSSITLATAIYLFDGLTSWFVAAILQSVWMAGTWWAVSMTYRKGRTKRVVQANERGLTVTFAGNKGMACCRIDRAQIRCVKVRQPLLGLAWRLDVYTDWSDYVLHFKSPACFAVLAMQTNLCEALNLPQDQQSVPFWVTSRPLDR